MIVKLRINGIDCEVQCSPFGNLLGVVRDLGFYGAKFGDEQGLSGADTVLMDGRPINSGSMLAAQAAGHRIDTIEALGEHPDQGWRHTLGLHALQQAFVETGAIQCGYCTPAQILAAKSLLESNAKPTEAQVREAISGVLCRCTGYLKPTQAILKAAAAIRGETPNAGEAVTWDLGPSGSADDTGVGSTDSPDRQLAGVRTRPRVVLTPQTQQWNVVGKPEVKVDAVKLAQGKPSFTADMQMRGMLFARVLHSPYAHARIRSIETGAAKALPGVAAVLTWQDLPRVVWSTAGQSDPIPGPLDTFSLDRKVRFVGDRVALVAAESAEIAQKALELIRVDYEMLPAVLDPSNAMDPEASKDS